MRYQPQIRDSRGRRLSRTAAATCVHDEIEKQIDHTAKKFRVSRSFVISTALAEFFGIEAVRFYDLDEKKEKRAA